MGVRLAAVRRGWWGRGWRLGGGWSCLGGGAAWASGWAGGGGAVCSAWAVGRGWEEGGCGSCWCEGRVVPHVRSSPRPGRGGSEISGVLATGRCRISRCGCLVGGVRCVTWLGGGGLGASVGACCRSRVARERSPAAAWPVLVGVAVRCRSRGGITRCRRERYSRLRAVRLWLPILRSASGRLGGAVEERAVDLVNA